jgi:hypothetical protein
LNVPKKALFELGFGYKYQYLLTVLIHCLIKNKIDLNTYENKLNTIVLKNNDIHANVRNFIMQLNSIIPLIDKLEYNKNCLLMIEGESNYFEDINLFTYMDDVSKVYFIQVKGSMAINSKTNLQNAIISTIINMYKSKNSHLNFKLLIFINKILSNFYLLLTDKDKSKIVFLVLKELKIIKKDKSLILFNKLERILSEYIEEIYNNPNEFPLLINYIYNKDKRVFNKYSKITEFKYLNKEIFKLKNIIDKATIVENLDYRLVYYFLKKYYGNNKLKKILWNIEMNAMDGKTNNIDAFKLKLKNIQYSEIDKIKFSKDKKKFRIGKIL